MFVIMRILLLLLSSSLILSVDSSESSRTNKTETETTTTPRTRRVFTRKSTTTTVSVDSSTLDVLTTTIKSIETTKSLPVEEINATTTIEESIITGIPPSPSIKVKIMSKKSLHVRNCGERMGEDVPFMALLVHSNPLEPESKKTLSKAVLISERFVISTVSSIYHSEAFWKVTSVRLGDFVTWNRFAVRDKTLMRDIEVDEIFYHQKNDFAMISMKESVTFTEVIRPACLPSSDSYNFKELKSHFCRRMKGQSFDVTLKNASPLSIFDCSQFFSRKHSSALSKRTEFCVWDEVGDDCAGDVGNALFTTHNGRFFVVGLRSYITTDEELTDPTTYPGVYVKIGSMLNWISHVLNYYDENHENNENSGKNGSLNSTDSA